MVERPGWWDSGLSAGPRAAASRSARRRRGYAVLLAMVMLGVFAVLGVGFYAAVNVSSQLAANERRGVDAMITAESAIGFMRYQLAQLDVPDTITADAQFKEAYLQLAAALDGTDNLNRGRVGFEPGVITIPETGYVPLDEQGRKRFRVRLEQAGDLLIANFRGEVDDSAVARSIEVRFGRAQNASTIFNFGIASKGRVLTGGNSRVVGATDPTKGSILSTSGDPNPVDIQGKEVSGDITTVNKDAVVSFKSGTSIGGTTVPEVIRATHIHRGAPPPEFPELDTGVYAKYAKNPYVPGAAAHTNVYVPPGTDPTLDGATVRGVLYVDAPNKLTISGKSTLQCVIVGPSKAALDVAANQINISGTATCLPVAGLPADYDPVNDPDGEVRKLGGAFIIAPGFATSLSGTMGTIGGSIITSKFTMLGTASGTIEGSVIVQDDQPTEIGGTSAVTIASTGTTAYPPGVTFGHHYAPVPGSYLELSAGDRKSAENDVQVVASSPSP